jgi:hypothetical protein
MHLTNYAINKNNDKFIQPETQYDDMGHKRSLSGILEYLDE